MLKYKHNFAFKSTLIVLFCFLFSSCSLPQPKPFITETHELQDFSSLKIDGIGQVTITEGDINSITIVAEPAILKKITYSISEDTLYINVPDNMSISSLDPRLSIQFMITARGIKSIQNYGACSVTGSGLTGKTLQIDQDAVGNIKLSDINYDSAELTLSGSGNVELTGVLREQTVTLNGSVIYSSSEIQSRRVDAQLSGKSTASVWVTDVLNVETTENASFQFYGLPQNTYLGMYPDNVQALGQK